GPKGFFACYKPGTLVSIVLWSRFQHSDSSVRHSTLQLFSEALPLSCGSEGRRGRPWGRQRRTCAGCAGAARPRISPLSPALRCLTSLRSSLEHLRNVVFFLLPPFP